MYDELVKDLRESAPKALAEADFDFVEGWLKEAADAIEELSSQLDDFKRLCLPLKENRLYKYCDGSLVEVFLMPLPQPPNAKEGE